MAYLIKRTSHFTDELKFTTDSGEVVACIPVDLDIDRIAQDLYKRYFDLIHVQQETAKLQVHEQTPEALAAQMEKLNGTVAALYHLLFGEENTSRMLAFFDGNYTELLAQTYPYLVDVVIPAIRERADARKKELLTKQRKIKWRR